MRKNKFLKSLVVASAIFFSSTSVMATQNVTFTNNDITATLQNVLTDNYEAYVVISLAAEDGSIISDVNAIRHYEVTPDCSTSMATFDATATTALTVLLEFDNTNAQHQLVNVVLEDIGNWAMKTYEVPVSVDKLVASNSSLETTMGTTLDSVVYNDGNLTINYSYHADNRSNIYIVDSRTNEYNFAFHQFYSRGVDDEYVSSATYSGLTEDDLPFLAIEIEHFYFDTIIEGTWEFEIDLASDVVSTSVDYEMDGEVISLELDLSELGLVVKTVQNTIYEEAMEVRASNEYADLMANLYAEFTEFVNSDVCARLVELVADSPTNSLTNTIIDLLLETPTANKANISDIANVELLLSDGSLVDLSHFATSSGDKFKSTDSYFGISTIDINNVEAILFNNEIVWELN
ncbi:MAG: hypothetical protein ATN34_04810 [Epulopiscium sp. Nele67-Bin002]|nr:MAG: hypothetical protein ATN34_04810 [Epulopiscium sp. Nele67-Bin002]